MRRATLFRRSTQGDLIGHRQTLEALVSGPIACEASNPRDTIYTVLSLAKDTYRGDPSQSAAQLLLHQKDRPLGHGIQPEYEGDVFEVCKDFIQSCTDRPESPSLDIICRHWAPICRKFTSLEQADVLKDINCTTRTGCMNGNWLVGCHLSKELPSALRKMVSKVGYMETRSLAYYDETTTRRLAVISTLRFWASMKAQKSVTAATEQRQIKRALRAYRTKSVFSGHF
jgi:hypothetical protein